MAVAVKVRDWGNSKGVILPKEFVKENHITTGEEISIEITRKRNVLKGLFGTGKFKRSTEEIMRDARRELESKWD